MRLSKNIKKSAILMDMASTGKEEALEELVHLICKAYRIKDQEEILRAVKLREDKQSTGIGSGIAVPHAKTPAVDKLYIAFGISREGIDFDSIDGGKAHIFFMLVSPKDVSGPHIKALAGISRLIKHEEFSRALAECRDENHFFELVTEAEKKYL
jgi:fructose-specific phosphotransferase system IIA component